MARMNKFVEIFTYFLSFLNVPQMLKILNGEDYISSSVSESTPRFEESLVSAVSGSYASKTNMSDSYTSTANKSSTSLRFTPTGRLAVPRFISLCSPQ